MFYRNYHANFVKPSEESLQVQSKKFDNNKVISGKEAKELYLQEIQSINSPSTTSNHVKQYQSKRKIQPIQLSDKDTFLAVENNDTETVKSILNQSPDKINLTDSYGWTLLMIACQANSVEVAKELLKRKIDTSVRDKAGNSARSLVIKNKNLALCNLLLDYHDKNADKDIRIPKQMRKEKHKPEFYCEVCNANFADKEEHLSSTIHNITSSKGRKFVASYKIPASNRGFQIMVKSGWDRNTGLGRDGSGKIYPIRTEQKKDRKGLGTKKTKLKEKQEDVKVMNKNVLKRLNHENKRKEIDFRREFY